MEYDFVVAPGRSATAIRLTFPSAGKVSVSPEGDLRLISATGEFRQPPPWLYQRSENGTVEVQGEYVQTGPHEFGFRVGPTTARGPWSFTL